MELTYFPARPEHFVEIAALVNAAYRGDAARRGWTSEADLMVGQRTTPERLRRELTDTSRCVLCARRGDGPIEGVVMIEALGDGEFHLSMLTVNPDLQAQGLGKRLLEAAETYARGLSGQRMTLSVLHRRDALMAWYERRGYRKNGHVRRFDANTDADSRPIEGELSLVYFAKSL